MHTWGQRVAGGSGGTRVSASHGNDNSSRDAYNANSSRGHYQARPEQAIFTMPRTMAVAPGQPRPAHPRNDSHYPQLQRASVTTAAQLYPAA